MGGRCLGLALDASVEIIKNTFAKCGISEKTSEYKDDIVDEEFDALFTKLEGLKCDMTTEEYLHFDDDICSSLPAIISDMVGWRVSSVKANILETDAVT